MEENYLEKETREVIHRLKDFFSFEELKENFGFSYIAKDKDDSLNYHEYLEELERYLRLGHTRNRPSVLDLNPSFEALDKGAILSTGELYSIAELLSSSMDFYDQLGQEADFYHLRDDALDLNPVLQLQKDIHFAINPDYTIADHASNALFTVRGQIRSVEKRLSEARNDYKNRYSRYLSEDVITMKGGEEALPVKSDSKGRIKGSVVSYSSTGQTVYRVPYEVLDLRNKLSSLKQEESREETKILSELSQKAGKQLLYIKKDYKILRNFDRFLSCVRFGSTYHGSIAELSDSVFELQGFFHPLLKANKIIKNHLSLGKNNPKCLLITGPNAGGKSVLIKAVALCVRMDKLGRMVPCEEGAKLPFVDYVYFLGGDNQSVLDNLSTFSSQLRKIKEITEKATKDSLVIIDEVGEGTSPKDGEALGVGILKFFENKNCFTLLTSHFDGLKIYAAADKLCLTGAREYNTSGRIPTYHLLLGTTGKSYGILLAKQMGLNPVIIQDAVDFEASRSNQDTDALMEKLTEEVSENEKKKKELENKRADLDRIREKKQKAIDALNEEKNSIRIKAEKKVQRLVEQRIEEINSVWATKSDKNLSYSELSEVKGKLNQIKESTSKKEETKKSNLPLPDLKVGDEVRDEDFRRATVLSVKKNEAVLDRDGLRITRKIQGLKLAPKQVKEKTKEEIPSRITTIVSGQGLECNIIGRHVDEARRKAVSFLNSARISKFEHVRIIHGLGTFALKNALWKYLANHKDFIKDYRLGGEGEGGLGATVITLK